ncbi:MAG: hypothetical protein IT337_14980 [Thermomicrobiales bacterium]|nr:hypothetical protein [Thermomicrobiales bacterium]
MLGRLRDAMAQTKLDRRRVGIVGLVVVASAATLAIAGVGDESGAADAKRRQKPRRDRARRGGGDRATNPRNDRGGKRAADREERQAALAEERQAARSDRRARRIAARADGDRAGNGETHLQRATKTPTATPTKTPSAGGGGKNDHRGGGNDNDNIVGGRAGEAGDRLRRRGRKLTGAKGKGNDNESGIHVTRDPATGALTVQTGNIDYESGGDGSMSVSTNNITFDQEPIPTPTPFPIGSTAGRTPAATVPALIVTPSPEGGNNTEFPS